MLELTAIDLFAGAGGFSEGLRRAGYNVIAAIDSDSDASDSFRLNHPDTRILNCDIEDIDPFVLRSELNLPSSELDLITACPPCQGFSTIGNQDITDPRNDLVLSMLKYASAFRPKVLVFENVPSVKNWKKFRQLKRKLRKLGYGLRQYEVNAVNFGVPQFRRRLVMIGVRGCSGGRLPRDIVQALDPRPRVREVDDLFSASAKLEITDPLGKSRNIKPATKRRLSHIPIGGSRSDLPDELVLECHRRIGKQAASVYGRVRLGQPSSTMTTRCTRANRQLCAPGNG